MTSLNFLGKRTESLSFFVLRLFGEKSWAGSEPHLAYYSADFSVSYFLKFATSKNEVANFKIHSPLFPRKIFPFGAH